MNERLSKEITTYEDEKTIKNLYASLREPNDVPERVSSLLLPLHIETIYDLTCLTEEELRAIPNMTDEIFDQIVELASPWGISDVSCGGVEFVRKLNEERNAFYESQISKEDRDYIDAFFAE